MCVLCFAVDYILQDPSERERVFILNVPQPFPNRVIRGPVPWSRSFHQVHNWHIQHLFTVNPMMFHLQNLWVNRYVQAHIQ